VSIALAKIVSSESHILYQARIYDKSESSTPPKRQHFSFGRFVVIESFDDEVLSDAKDEELKEQNIGVIVNTRLINPEQGYFGPHLTIPHHDNALFAPDYLNEFGILISILLLGELHQEHGVQGIPSQVIPVGSEVLTLDDEELLRFHFDEKKRFQLRYYPLLSEIGSGFSSSLLDRICGHLLPLCQPNERRLLSILRKNSAWQSTLGTLR